MNDRVKPTFGIAKISYNEKQALAGVARKKAILLRSPRLGSAYFSHQRDKWIDAAKRNWLVHMDLDERVTPNLASDRLQAIQTPDKDGYRYRRLNYFMHRPMKGGGWRDWNLVHLARRDKFRFGGMFHESCHLDAPESREGQLQSLMVHFNEDNLEKRFRKSGTYMEELLKRVEGRPKPVRLIDILGRPFVEFTRKYLLKKGFLDGTPGLISAIHSATAVFRANALVWDRQNALSRRQIEEDFQQQWRDGGGVG